MPPPLPSRPSKDVDKISASWLCKLLDCVAYAMVNPRGDGKTIINESSGTLRALRQPGGGTDGGGSEPFTLFEVVKGTDNSIVILGYNPAEKRYTHNYVDFGLSRFEITDNQEISVSSGGVIYLDITYSGGTQYIVTVEFGTDLPAQNNNHIYWYLATVIWADGKISEIQQPPTGMINIPCRAG